MSQPPPPSFSNYNLAPPPSGAPPRRSTITASPGPGPAPLQQGSMVAPPNSSFVGPHSPMPGNAPPPSHTPTFLPPPGSMSGAYGGPPRSHSRPNTAGGPPPGVSYGGASANPDPIPAPSLKKRLICTCDGTWLNADNGLKNGQRQPPSNVARLGWAIKDTSRDGIPQIVHYQAGVGSRGGIIARFLGGALGEGLEGNVRASYSFLSINWRVGDEIFLFGFSRGAYTARSIGGMIGDMGLLTRAALPCFTEIWEDYQHRQNDSYVARWPDVPFKDKPRFGPEYVRRLEELGLTRRNVRIRAIGCWDTVGSLGVPRVPALEVLGIQSKKMQEYSFYDTTLSPVIDNAFQALALDENRSPFSPALWEKATGQQTNLKQVWFPGVHSNIGGGYADADLANISLAWMMSRLEGFLDFRPNYIMIVHSENQAHYKNTEQRRRWWSFGELYKSNKGIYILTGKKDRTPGDYYRSDPLTGRPTSRHLKNTNEYMHASVRARIGLDGPGKQDRGLYDPPALNGWTFAPDDKGTEAGEPMIVWSDRNNRGSKRAQKTIPEAVILETERRLLEQSPKVETYVLDMNKPPKKKRRSRPPP